MWYDNYIYGVNFEKSSLYACTLFLLQCRATSLCTYMSLCVVQASLYISTPAGMKREIATINQENVVLRQQYDVLSSELRELFWLKLKSWNVNTLNWSWKSRGEFFSCLVVNNVDPIGWNYLHCSFFFRTNDACVSSKEDLKANTAFQ